MPGIGRLGGHRLKLMKTPMTIHGDITGGCNSRCYYCNHFESESDVAVDIPLDEWIEFFKELKGKKFQDLDAYLQIANIYVIQGKCDEALQYLDKAVALDPIGYYWQVADLLPYWDPLKNEKRYRKIMDPIEQSIAEWRKKIEKLEREGF